ncbi:MAG: hypothetical protein Q8P41_21255 [Pseudomonadota bacterium]|nr:hypothetical protein [Pseudomonadota bacterium]
MSLSAGLLLGAMIGNAAPLPGTPPGTTAATVAVLPPGVPPERVELLRGALAERGHPDAVLVPAEDYANAADLVRVEGLPDAEECDHRVPIDDWRSRFQAARAQFQLLAFADALAELVSLDVELVCLSSPPAASDLFRLELGLAEAHTFLAQSAGKDAGRRGFHEGEAQGALERAASFGASLSAPADLPADVLAAYDATRRKNAREDTPRVVVTGPGARVGARFNGRPLLTIAFDAVPGVNLVEAADGATVTAAARLRLGDGRTLVWLAPEGEPPLNTTVADALEALAEHNIEDDGRMLLAAAGHLVGDGARVLYVVDDRAGLVLWEASGDTLAVVEAAELRPTTVDTWRFVVGAGPSVGWTSISGGALEGLGGPNAGVSVHARVAVAEWIAVAMTVDPWAVASPIPLEQGGGTLMRATVPGRVGVRFGRRTGRIAVEGGVDAGIHWFGAFPQGGVDVPRVSFLAGGAAGISGALGPGVGMRFQGWFGAGLGYVGGGVTLGLEGRL